MTLILFEQWLIMLISLKSNSYSMNQDLKEIYLYRSKDIYRINRNHTILSNHNVFQILFLYQFHDIQRLMIYHILYLHDLDNLYQIFVCILNLYQRNFEPF